MLQKSNTTTLNMFNSTSLLNYYVVSGNVLQTTINDAIDTFTNNRAIYDKIFRPIDELDTTQLSNLNGLFKNNTTFNEYIGSWNVSNVIYMEETFMGATSFNRRISKWNISNVINMSNMFNGASSFKKSLVNWTNLYNLIFTLDENDNIIATKTNVNTENMFTGTTSLDYDTVIGNVTQDTILDIVDYFNFSYSDALIEYEDIPNWDTSKITDMSELFQNFKTFNEDISGWDTSRVTSMSYMFEGAEQFNQNINI